ncbi:hypothetical protein [Methyloceanibacter sp.]|uniref:hypothetical protein n=1 Tax=Methyloceanibacter sp. TaxID=1965321 RepID=UPI003C708DA6
MLKRDTTLDVMLDDMLFDDADDIKAFDEECLESIRQLAIERGFPPRQAQLAAILFDKALATKLGAEVLKRAETIH